VNSAEPFLDSALYPARSGNLVRPLIDGIAAFQRICEAIESAEHSVFVTVAFVHPRFRMPGDRGSLFDVLDRAAARGLDVRALFWRAGDEIDIDRETVFGGSPDDLDWLRARGTSFSMRFDHARRAHCHHQKSWVIDAGRAGEAAFVGGINLNPRALAKPGHTDEPDGIHDVYVELQGPAARDVHHNFADRWNRAGDASFGDRGGEDLGLPAPLSRESGEGRVQIQRTLGATGEQAIFDQYIRAIAAAEHSIYLENQALESPEIVAALAGALQRDVAVAALVPSEIDPAVREARRNPQVAAYFDQLAALGDYERFTLAGLAAPGPGGKRRPVHVHAKLMIVDDEFATIGSANLRARSFFRHSELNASFFDPATARELRCALFAEHLGLDTSDLTAGAALERFGGVARGNARKPAEWQGIAFALDPADYAR